MLLDCLYPMKCGCKSSSRRVAVGGGECPLRSLKVFLSGTFDMERVPISLTTTPVSITVETWDDPPKT